MKEIWEDIKEYEGLYQISDLGKVKSLWYGMEKILKSMITPDGYGRVFLYKDGGKPYNIAHLVWDHFGNRKRNGRKLQIDHINNIKTDDRIKNLQLLTNRENCSKGKKQYPKTSEYTGVWWDKERNKWQSKITINGKGKHLGRFPYEIDAYKAYQKALEAL